MARFSYIFVLSSYNIWWFFCVLWVAHLVLSTLWKMIKILYCKIFEKNEEKYPIYYKLLFKSSNGHIWNQKCSQCYAFLNVILLYQHVTVQKTFQNSMEKYVTSLGFFFHLIWKKNWSHHEGAKLKYTQKLWIYF